MTNNNTLIHKYYITLIQNIDFNDCSDIRKVLNKLLTIARKTVKQQKEIGDTSTINIKNMKGATISIKTDTKEPKDTKDTKLIEDTKDTKLIEDTKDTKLIEDTKDTKLIEDTKDTKLIEDTKDTKLIEDTKDTENSNDTKLTKDINDSYTENILQEHYSAFRTYVIAINKINENLNLSKKIRACNFPEGLSENIVKFIIHNKLNDKTTIWDCKSGDLYSQIEKKLEVKCFASDAPISFSPNSNWTVIYFLDARKLFDNYIVLYRCSLIPTSDKWKQIKFNKNETFEDQIKLNRRPRIIWKSLYKTICTDCDIIYEGTIENIFTYNPITSLTTE